MIVEFVTVQPVQDKYDNYKLSDNGQFITENKITGVWYNKIIMTEDLHDYPIKNVNYLEQDNFKKHTQILVDDLKTKFDVLSKTRIYVSDGSNVELFEIPLDVDGINEHIFETLKHYKF